MNSNWEISPLVSGIDLLFNNHNATKQTSNCEQCRRGFYESFPNADLSLQFTIANFTGWAIPFQFFHFSIGPSFREGDVKFSTHLQLPRIGNHTPICVLHQAIPARQYLFRVKQDKMLSGILHSCKQLYLRYVHRLDKTLRQIDFPVSQ